MTTPLTPDASINDEILNPVPGKFWGDHGNFGLAVLEVTDTDIVLVDETCNAVGNTYEIDFKRSKRIKREEFVHFARYLSPYAGVRDYLLDDWKHGLAAGEYTVPVDYYDINLRINKYKTGGLMSVPVTREEKTMQFIKEYKIKHTTLSAEEAFEVFKVELDKYRESL